MHGPEGRRPSYLTPEVELIKGDVRDAEAVKKALQGVDAVFHLAAMVGVGQSMYEIEKYTSINNSGTAVLLEALPDPASRKLVVASSMSIYGEGRYRDSSGKRLPDRQRTVRAAEGGRWELYDDSNEPLMPVPTPETKDPLARLGLRPFQVRPGADVRSSSATPTGFRWWRCGSSTSTARARPSPTRTRACWPSSPRRLLNGNSPRIFEDGLQQRDFVSVHDVATACRLALEVDQDRAAGLQHRQRQPAISVLESLQRLAPVLGRSDIAPEITGNYRAGDIRHCFADITAARDDSRISSRR